MNIKGQLICNETKSAIGLRHYHCIVTLDGNSECETIFDGRNHPRLIGKLYRIAVLEDPANDPSDSNFALYEHNSNAEILRLFSLSDTGYTYSEPVFHYAMDYDFTDRVIRLTYTPSNIITNVAFVITTFDEQITSQEMSNSQVIKRVSAAGGGCCGRK